MTGFDDRHCTLGRDDEGRVQRVVVCDGSSELVSLNGHKGVRVVGPVHDLLRARGVTARQWASGADIPLDEDTTAQLELLLRAVTPLRRGDRIDAVAEGVARMSREEAAYWHAKTSKRFGMRALRLLLSEAK